MFGVWSIGLVGLSSFWMFVKDGGIIWLLVAGVAIAQAAKFFGDSMIAADGPFSQFTIWPKLLAFGLLSEAVFGAMLAFSIGSNPANAQPLVAFLGKSPKWIEYGPSVIAAGGIICSAIAFKMFVSRIWFRRIPYFGPVVFFVTVWVANWCLQPAVRKVTDITPESTKKFWEAALGANVATSLFVTWFLGFILCEIVNSTIRRRICDNDKFTATTWPSFPACYLPPLLGLFVARFALVWCGLSGAIPFAVIVLLASGILCWFWTKRIVQSA